MADFTNVTPEQAQELIAQLASATGLKVNIDSQEQREKRKKRKLPKVLTDKEVQKLLSALNTKTKSGIKNRAMLETLYRAGLRVQELCNLTPADVDLNKGDIYVQLGKGSKDRHISIGPTLIEWLKKWEEVRPASEWYFCTFQGGQTKQRQIRDVCYRCSERSGVLLQDGKNKRPVNPHVLRHSYATRLLESGKFNIREIQQLMGHENVTTTQIYTHVSDMDLDTKIKALG